MTTNRQLIQAFVIFLVSFFSLIVFALVTLTLVSSGLTAIWVLYLVFGPPAQA